MACSTTYQDSISMEERISCRGLRQVLDDYGERLLGSIILVEQKCLCFPSKSILNKQASHT